MCSNHSSQQYANCHSFFSTISSTNSGTIRFTISIAYLCPYLDAIFNSNHCSYNLSIEGAIKCTNYHSFFSTISSTNSGTIRFTISIAYLCPYLDAIFDSNHCSYNLSINGTIVHSHEFSHNDANVFTDFSPFSSS